MSGAQRLWIGSSDQRRVAVLHDVAVLGVVGVALKGHGEQLGVVPDQRRAGPVSGRVLAFEDGDGLIVRGGGGGGVAHAM